MIHTNKTLYFNLGKDNTVFYGTVKSALQKGVTQEEVDRVIAASDKEDAKVGVRLKISKTVADDLSLLAVTSNLAQTLMLLCSQDLVALEEAKSFEDYKKIRSKYIADLGSTLSKDATHLKGMLKGVKSGKVDLTCLQGDRSLSTVIDKAASTSTDISSILNKTA